MTGALLSEGATALVLTLAGAVVSLGMLQNIVYVAQLVLAQRALVQERPEPQARVLWRRTASIAPPIALLLPAHNEAANIVESVRSMLALDYPEFEVIVINDGSGDETLVTLRSAFALQRIVRSHDDILAHAPIRAVYRSAIDERLIVIDKEHGGKADALNAGLNLARAPLVSAIDADSVLEPDALLRAAQPFMDDPERVVAVGGTVRIANGCDIRDGRVRAIGVAKNFWARVQTIEYLRAFLLARLAWSQFGALAIISGAFGLFRRSVLVEIGGYARDTVGEDLELVMRLHRRMQEGGKPYRVAYVPEPVCWTEAPETLSQLARQRARWQRGALETVAKHRAMLFNPRYGRIGLMGLGQMLFLDVIWPFFELLGYLLIPAMWLIGILSFDFVLAFLAVTFAFGVALSVGALAIEEGELRRYPRARDIFLLAIAAVAENFGYRQLNAVWRLIGTWQWLRGVSAWGEVARRGFRGGDAGPR